MDHTYRRQLDSLAAAWGKAGVLRRSLSVAGNASYLMASLTILSVLQTPLQPGCISHGCKEKLEPQIPLTLEDSTYICI